MAKAKSVPVPTVSADEKEWRARSDMRTLSEAEEIKADSKRHAAAQAKAKEEMSKIAAVAGTQPKDTTEPTKKSGGKESMERFVARREKK